MKKYDVIVIGAGPGGYTAGLYAIRYSMSVLMIGADPGGYMKESTGVENWPGDIMVSGPDLMKRFHDQMEHWNIDFLQDFVTKIEKTTNNYIVHVGDKQFEALSIILANGSKRRELGVPGEKEFMGRGVSVCATCDGAFFREKTVAVIGGGDAAMHSAVVLSKIAKKVYLIHRRDVFRAEHINIEHAKSAGNIEFIMNTSPKEIQGDQSVKKIIFNEEHPVHKKELAVDGIFVEIGFIPDSTFAQQLGVASTPNGFIKVGKGMETNVPGIFAAGDITEMPQKQAITAAGDAARAGLSAYNYVSNIKHKRHE